MIPLSRAGRYCFGAAVAASGLMQLVNGSFVRLASPLPPWMGPAAAWSSTTGVLMLLIGAAMLSGYRTKTAALLFGALILGLFIVKGVPDILSNPRAGFMWTNPAKMLALFGGAMVLGERGGKWPWLAPVLLGIFLLICGAQHFVYAGFVDGLVPAWLPPGQRFWTLFAAVALLTGGVGVILPRPRRLAGLWSGVMIFSWVFLVHLPLAMKSAPEFAGVFEALALAGTAWLVATQATPVKR
jgi:uncharacterized membrane protein